MKTASAMAAVCLLQPILSHAERGDRATYQLETITVTSTRTGETDLQNTPISVTTFDASTLFERGVSNVDGLTHATPGLSIAQNVNQAQVYIRGVGTNNVFPGSETSSTVHLDGVYLSRPTMIFSDFIDIEQVEVLKGPQGTLYGRNSIGGTINLKSSIPSDQLRIKASVDVGNFDARRLSAAISGPLLGDRLMGSIAVLSSNTDGYVENLNPAGPSHLADEDRSGIKAALRWRLTDEIDFILRSDYLKAKESPPIYKPTYKLANGSAIPSNALFIDDPFTVNLTFEPTVKLENYGTSGLFTWDLSDDYTVSSMTAYRGVDFLLRNDSDYVEINTFDFFQDESQHQFSQEFQLIKKSGSLTGLLGAYYFKEQDDVFVDSQFFGGSFIIDADVKTQAWALFFQADYAFTEQWSMIVGTRYNQEKKTIAGSVAGIESQNKIEEDAWTPKVGLNYQASDDVFLFASISKGFKSGGFDFTRRFDQSEFGSETLIAYEVGMKSTWFDHRLRVNASAFFYDYQDVQVQGFANNGLVISNAEQAKSNGFELETTFLPNAHWQFDAGIAYLDATYVQFDDAAEDTLGIPFQVQNIDVQGNRLNASPEWTVDLTARYYQNISAGSLTYRLNYYWQDETFFTPANLNTKRQSAYELINASIGYLTDDEHLEVMIYGDNLTNRDYFNSLFDFNPFDGIAGKINTPRTYGIKVLYTFD